MPESDNDYNEGLCDCGQCRDQRAVERELERARSARSAEQNNNTHFAFFAHEGRTRPQSEWGDRPTEAFRGFFFEAESMQPARAPSATHKDRFNRNGLRYVGKYYPAAMIGSCPTILSDTEYDCPHCASEAASTLAPFSGQIGWIGTNTGKLSPTHLSAFQNAPTDDAGNYWKTDPNPGIEYCEQVCSTCKRYGHNSRTCSHRRFLDKIGIEIEGRWLDFDEVAEVASDLEATGSTDGSIRSHPTSGDYTNYEWKTKPGFLSSALNQLVTLYPDSTGADCGMHVHMSFMDRTVHCQLMTDEFYDYYLARWKAWGEAMGFHKWNHFWSRLSGNNQYCRQNPKGMNNLRNPMGEVDRYVHLNFGSWGSHKTLECRMLPMFANVNHGILAVTELVNIVNDYLDMQSEGEAVFVEHSLVSDVATPVPFSLSSEVLTTPPSPDEVVNEIHLANILPPAPGFLRLTRKDSPMQNIINNLLTLQRAA